MKEQATIEAIERKIKELENRNRQLEEAGRKKIDFENAEEALEALELAVSEFKEFVKKGSW